MKKVLFNLKNIFQILVFVFFLVLYSFLTYINKPMSIDLKNINGLYNEKKNSLDMVYVGGSASFVFYEPLLAYEEFGIASYDYGSNTISAEAYITLLKEMYKNQNPEVVLIDARAFQYRSVSVSKGPSEMSYRNTLTGLRFSKNKIDFINDYVEQEIKGDKLSYYFDLIKYHRPLDNSFTLDNIRMFAGTYKNVNKGFYFVPKIAKVKREKIKTDKKTAIDKKSEKLLVELLEYMKTTNSKYLFIISTYAETKEEKENYNYIKEIVEKYGYDFLDTNEYIKEMDIDFEHDLYNKDHVNIYGAEKYTKFVGKYIQENYNLPDRREDKNYNSWDKLLDEWHKKVTETKKIIDKKYEGL